MGRLIGKCICMLVLYGAGFATALYLLAPSEGEYRDGKQDVCRSDQDMDRRQMQENLHRTARVVRAGVDQMIVFAEEQTARAADFIERKLEQHRAEGG